MEKDLLRNLTYSTFLSLDGGKSYGSGFKLLIENRLFLVTAKHVLFDDNSLRSPLLLITSRNAKGHDMETKRIEVDLTAAKVFKSAVYDVATVELGFFEKTPAEEGNGLFSERDFKPHDYTTIRDLGSSDIVVLSSDRTRPLDKIGIANEVYLVGCPTSLIFADRTAFDVDRPLLRRGIVAGINSQNTSFIIDCAAYFGNSGSPIVELCEDGVLRVIGLVSRYIPFVTEWKNNREPSISHVEYSNSGYSVCVPMNVVFDLIDDYSNDPTQENTVLTLPIQ